MIFDGLVDVYYSHFFFLIGHFLSTSLKSFLKHFHASLFSAIWNQFRSAESFLTSFLDFQKVFTFVFARKLFRDISGNDFHLLEKIIFWSFFILIFDLLRNNLNFKTFNLTFSSYSASYYFTILLNFLTFYLDFYILSVFLLHFIIVAMFWLIIFLFLNEFAHIFVVASAFSRFLFQIFFLLDLCSLFACIFVQFKYNDDDKLSVNFHFITKSILIIFISYTIVRFDFYWTLYKIIPTISTLFFTISQFWP